MKNMRANFPWKMWTGVVLLAGAVVLASVAYSLTGGGAAQAVRADEAKPKIGAARLDTGV
jgi:hypothetical protein